MQVARLSLPGTDIRYWNFGKRAFVIGEGACDQAVRVIAAPSCSGPGRACRSKCAIRGGARLRTMRRR